MRYQQTERKNVSSSPRRENAAWEGATIARGLSNTYDERCEITEVVLFDTEARMTTPELRAASNRTPSFDDSKPAKGRKVDLNPRLGKENDEAMPGLLG